MKKPLAPGEKQSGFENMQDDYSYFNPEAHNPFVLDTILPAIFDQARKTGHPPEVVSIAIFMSLATVLQVKGLSRNTLMALIDGSRLEMHDAPEVLQ
ncbi:MULTISPECIES: hypothetical protein [unclassified Pseudomonas]|uniref:hypothetical protein n=1 Tax=unclassified Pseudomonas TaxID=196821 RepID=UPI00257B0BCC|nr:MULTISPECIES: hypothetical protein [unclassified Pseudomonas]